MFHPRLRLNRWIAPVSVLVQRRWIARFMDSRVYVSAIVVLFLLSLSLFLAFSTNELMEGRFLIMWRGTQGAEILILLGFLVGCVLVATGLAATSQRTAVREGTTGQILERCRQLLEAHGFHVSPGRGSRLLARRGRQALAESEWRTFPLGLQVIARRDGDRTRLIARATTGVTAYTSIRTLLHATSLAVADGDSAALTAVDSALVRRQGLLMGGLARTVFQVLVLSVLVTLMTLAGLVSIASKRLIELQTKTDVYVHAESQALEILRDMDRPLREQLNRFLRRRADHVGPPDPLATRRKVFFDEFRSTNLVLGTTNEDGQVELLLPERTNPLRPLAEAMYVSGSDARIHRVGNRVFRRMDTGGFAYSLAPELGFEKARVVLGSLLSFGDLTQTAESLKWRGGELVLFGHGASVVRYRWTGTSTIAEPVSMKIPDVAAHDGIDIVQLQDLVLRPKWMDSVRRETQAGADFWVVALGDVTADSGFSGMWYSVKVGDTTAFSRSSFYDLEWFYFVQLAVMFATFWVGLLVTLGVATIVAGRISRPVLQVRDALRAIAGGDYSVRVEASRSDEIGQLQTLVSQAAEELRKRDAMRNLFGKYLSKQVAARLMEGDTDVALAGVRKEVSVLFADVRGFTTYSEGRDPEQVTQTLNEYFEVMVDVIGAHEGVLDKYIGDGLMVVFGAPMAQPDHAYRAVITALEMQAALNTLNLKRAQRGDEPIFIGVGVNTGLAISGNLGSIKRMEFTVIGDTVNLAARLESRALRGQILIGKLTYEKVKDQIQAESMGLVTVKGKTDPIEVWLLQGLLPSRQTA